jgi:hypothetical protein
VKLKYDESHDRDEKMIINDYNLGLSKRVGLSFRKKLPSEYFLVLFLKDVLGFIPIMCISVPYFFLMSCDMNIFRIIF